MARGEISPTEERRRKLVGINAETVTNVTSTDFPGHYPGEEHSWNLKKFKESFQIQFHHEDPSELSFSLIHLDASLANAFRRILLAEIPTLAIEHVYISANDSVVSDEVLAARLGLIPLTGSRQGLKWMAYESHRKPELGEDVSQDPNTEYKATDRNTIELKLNATCEWLPGMKEKKGDFGPEQLYHHSNVYASDLAFNPQGRQLEIFSGREGQIRSVHPRILITKLRPGDELDITAHAVKGIGADHAKFSPVATATYRLMPAIDIIQPILGHDAKKFAKCFPKGVIKLEEVTKEEADANGSGYEGKKGDKKAVVADPMSDTVSRECLRHDEFKDKVKLGRVRDHFIFSIESTGQIPSDELFIESVKILRGKCRLLKRDLDNLMR